MSIDDRYRRGKMVMALWRAMAVGQDFTKPQYVSPPPVFANRIKRLLDLDQRQRGAVFFEEGSDGKGYAADYSEFGIFNLGIALLMLDAGIVQQDVYLILENMLDELRTQYWHIHHNPPSLLQYQAPEDFPNAPASIINPLVASTKVFMLVRKLELEEVRFGGENLPKPIILLPRFCHGDKELVLAMDQVDFQRPSVLVIEIAEMFIYLRYQLSKDVLAKAMADARELKLSKRKIKAPTGKQSSGALKKHRRS